CLFITRRRPASPLLPYTTLFRSAAEHLPVTRRPARAMAAGQQRETPLDPGTHFVRGTQGDLALMAGDAAERHLLDETDIQPTLRSEEHTSELQSRENLVCRLLLE